MLSLGLLYTIISYQEAGLPDLNETALTLKAGVSRSLSRSWEGTLGGYFTALPIKNDQSTAARFAGANLRVGFTPSPTARTKLTIFGGAYYTTMFVSGDAFGFKNMSGPQIYPVLTHELSSQTQLSTYFKYSPVSKSFSEFSLGNREIAGGLAVTWKKQNSKTISLGVDLADIKLTVLQGVQSVAIHSQSVSGGVTFGL